MMKKQATLILLSALCLTLSAQTPRWMDPSVNEIGREPMRSSFIAFPSSQEALPGVEFGKSAQYLNIGGRWKFLWVKNADDARPSDFFKTSFSDASWGEIPVPGLWELNGYGDPVYTNHPYAWENFFRNDPPKVPYERNHVGMYRRSIQVPAEWKGKDIFVHIGSATSNLTLWVNGKEVGYSQDSKLEAEFNITKFVKAGASNLFAMEIYRWCDGTYLEDQDFWRLSGIGRDCYIYCRSKARLADVKFTPDLVNDYRDGSLNIKVTTAGSVSKVRAVLKAADGSVAAQKTVSPSKGAASIDLGVASVAKWSAECPALYRLEVAALDSKGGVYEHTAFNVGFRKVEIRNRQLLVNGAPILVKGVDRHEMNENTGYYLTREDMMRDIMVLKSLNINAVRTSHYPNSPMWYDLCDQYGIYLVDEGNIESHGMGYGEKTLAKNPAFHDAHMLRDSRMVLRDYNHPSVIIWSLGNEAGNGPNFMDTYDWIKAYDKSRPVQFEQAHEKKIGELQGSARNTDIVCPMYADYRWCESYCTSSSNPRPLIQCEYAHAMGNSMGGFKEYWDLVRKYPAYQGGFIWDFADQAFAWKDPASGKVTYRFGGDYNGIDVSDFNFNCNGIVGANRDIHPCTYEVRYQYQNIWTRDKAASEGKVEVFNENFFTDLSDYALEWDVTLNGEVVRSGRVEKLDVAPQKTSDVTLGYSKADIDAQPAGEVMLNVRYILKADKGVQKAGTCVAYDQICLRGYDWKNACTSMCASCPGAATCPLAKAAAAPVLDKQARSVTAGNVTLAFNDEGWLCSYSVDGRQMLAEPLMPQFYRALVDNDNGVIDAAKMKSNSYLAWRDVKWKQLYFTMEARDGNVAVRGEYQCKRLGTHLYFDYVVYPDGRISVTESMKASKSKENTLVNMLRFGMQASMPGEFGTVEFYGAGPWENYIDRTSAASIGHYTQKVADQFYPYYVACGESGNHCLLRWWAVRSDDGKGLRFTCGEPFGASAIAYPMSQIDRYSSDWRRHPSELEADGLTHINVDWKQSGVGCVNSWSQLPRPEYRIPYESRSWTFCIEPF